MPAQGNASAAWSWDPTTKRWINTVTGQRVDPATSHPSQKSNFLHHLPALAAVAAGGLGLSALGGGGAAAGAGATGAGATGGVLPSSRLPMSPLYTGPMAGGSQGVSAGLGAAGAGAADFLGNKPNLGRRIANAAGNALGGGEDGAPSWLQAAIAALSGVPALLAAQKNKPTAEELVMQQQIADMLASQQRRTTLQDPLYEAVTRLAMNRLPTDVQKPVGSL